MRFSLVSAVLLCFTTWMVHAIHAPATRCCPRWSNTQIKFENILDYTIQDGTVCEIPAVAFHTKSGKTICSDPNSRWAKSTICKVDEKKKKALQEKEQNEEGSTSIITPAVSSTSTNTPQPQKKGGNGRRRQRRRCRGGRKGQRGAV